MIQDHTFVQVLGEEITDDPLYASRWLLRRPARTSFRLSLWAVSRHRARAEPEGRRTCSPISHALGDRIGGMCSLSREL